MIEGKRTVLIFSLTLITVISWIGFEVYRTQRSPVTAPIQKQIAPLSPSLDLTIIRSLKNRKRLTEVTPLAPENQATVSSPTAF